MNELIKAKIYYVLYKRYSSMYNTIYHNVKNTLEFSKSVEDKIKLLEQIGNKEKYDSCGILSKEDNIVIQTLEYLLDDKKDIKDNP